jgi:hypothetical protein
MSYRILAGLLTVIASAALPPAAAQEASAITPDVRCMVVGGQFAQSADPARQAAGKMLAIYFMGKIMGRRPAVDLADLMSKEIARMSASDLQAESQRCGGELSDAGLRMKDVGAELIRRSSEAPKTEVHAPAE